MAETLGKRIFTAAVLVALALAILLWLPPWVTVAGLTLLALAGAWEWSAFLLTPSRLSRIAYVLLVAVLLGLAWRFCATPEARDAVLGVAVVWWLGALVWIVFAPRRASTWSAALAGVLALVPSWLALVWLRTATDGPQWVLFALVLVATLGLIRLRRAT